MSLHRFRKRPPEQLRPYRYPRVTTRVFLATAPCVTLNLPQFHTYSSTSHKTLELFCPFTHLRRVPMNTAYFFLSWLESQSRPSYRPSPLVAHVAWMYQLRWRSECRPNLSVISAAFMAFGRSYKVAVKGLIIQSSLLYSCFSIRRTHKNALLGLYSLRRRRLISIGIPIINLRRSSDRLRFIMGIPIPVRRRLLSE